MKNLKVFMMAFVCLFATMPLFAQSELSPNAQNFRKEVISYLESEGYKPYIDEDDDLCFKVDGTLYWITLGDGDGEKPVYIEFHRTGLGHEDANPDEVLQTANHINLTKKCVKASMGKKSTAFTIEMLSFSARDFSRTIPRCIGLLQGSYEEAKEYYSNL